MQESCFPLGYTRRQTGRASGNLLTSTPSQSPSPSTVSTRMHPVLTAQVHKELSMAQKKMERNPTPYNVRRHSQLKADQGKEKQAQTQASWKAKTASLNMRVIPKDLQLTESLNGDKLEQSRTTLQTTNRAVKEKAAVNVFARVFEEGGVKDVRNQTRAVLRNTASAGLAHA